MAVSLTCANTSDLSNTVRVMKRENSLKNWQTNDENLEKKEDVKREKHLQLSAIKNGDLS